MPLIRSLAFVLLVQSPAPELSALLEKAGVPQSVAVSCRGVFRPGRPGAFAVALTSGRGGRYAVIESDATLTDLASFVGQPDLSCYNRAESESLNRTIQRSDTIQGEIRPRWETTVVCGFVDNTTAHCWQFSPAERSFVKVGAWTT